MATEIGELRARLTADAQELKAEIRSTKKDFADLGVQGKKTAGDIGVLNNALGNVGDSKDQISRLTSALENVNARIEIQRKKLTALKDSYDSTFNEQRKSKLQEQILATEAALIKLERTSDDTAKKIWELEDGADSASDKFKKLSESLRQAGLSSSQIDNIERSLRAANPDILNDQITDVTAIMEALGATGEDIARVTAEMERNAAGAGNLSIEISSLGTAYTALAAAMSIVITKSIEASRTFEQSMVNVKAISQATVEEFKRLRNQALQLGSSTIYTASQAADAQALLAQAGMSTNDIIAALPAVLTAAAAGQTDLATTADIAASTLNGFGLSAEEAARVVDVLAKSSIDTNADMTDLGMAMKYVAPVAASMGISIEEATAAIGELSNAGIKGEMAGTQLRAILLALSSPSEEAAFYMDKLGVSISDSAGNIRPLGEIIGQLQTAFGRLTQAQQADVAATLAGREAASGFITLIQNGRSTLDMYTRSLENAGGTAAEVSGTQMDTLNGAITEMQSALEGAGISVGDVFAPAVRGVAEEIARLLTGFNNINPQLRTMIVVFSTVTPLIAGGAAAILALKTAFDAMRAAAAAAGVQMTLFSASVPIIGAVAVAVGVLSAGIAGLVSRNKEAAAAAKQFDEAQQKLNETLNASPLSRTTSDIEQMRTEMRSLEQLVKNVKDAEKELNDEYAKSYDIQDSKARARRKELRDALSDAQDALRAFGGSDFGVDQAAQALERYRDEINKSTPALLEMNKAQISELATKSDQIKSMESLAKRYNELNRIQNLDAAQKQELIDIANTLKKQYPELDASIDGQNRLRIKNIELVEGQISSERSLLDSSLNAELERVKALEKTTKAQRKAVEAQINNNIKLIESLNAVNKAQGSDVLVSPDGLEDEKIYIQAKKRVAAANEQAAALDSALLEAQRAKAALVSGNLDSYKGSGGGVDLTKPTKEKTAKAKSGKSAAELAAEARKKAYEADVATVRYQVEMFDWSAEQQIAAFEKVKVKHKQHLKESIEDEREMNLLLNRLHEDSAKSRYDISSSWITAEEKRMQKSSNSEIEIAQMKIDAWTRVRDRYSKDSEFYKDADDKLYQARKDMISATEKAMKELYSSNTDFLKAEERKMYESGATETEIAQMKLDLWTRVRDSYAKDSEYYKQADEQVYQAKKDLLSKQQKDAEAARKVEKKGIEDAKKVELAAIAERRKAYTDDIDARIADIDRLIKAEDRLNAEQDYESLLAEKKARQALLENAVSPEGRKEYADITAEIERMELEHSRDIRKQNLEDQKEALQDEKSERERAFDKEKEDAEKHYDALTDALENYQDDVKLMEVGLQDYRVDANQTANTQILADLDNFISAYNSKLASLTSASGPSQQANDLQEYNSNKDAWDEAKLRGDKAEMERLSQRNDVIRKQYGIEKDTGRLDKLPSYDVGGVVPGPIGAPMPAIIHGGEMIFNPDQFENMFRRLTAPVTPSSVTPAAAPIQHVENHFDMSVGAVIIEDQPDAEIMYTERERAARRLVTTGGGK